MHMQLSTAYPHSIFSFIIAKKASDVTVDCIDWNSVVDLSKHPLGFPKSPEDQDQIYVVKEKGHT